MIDCERKLDNLHVKFVSKLCYKNSHYSGCDLNFRKKQVGSRARKCAAHLKRVDNAHKPMSRWIIEPKLVEFTIFISCLLFQFIALCGGHICFMRAHLLRALSITYLTVKCTFTDLREIFAWQGFYNYVLCMILLDMLLL